MVEDTGNFGEQGTNPLGAFGDLNVEQLLDGQSKTLLVGHHRDVVETVKVRERLEVGPVLAQLLGAAMQKADVGVGTNNLFTLELENQAQHTVSGRMLGTEVDRVVPHLAGQDVILRGRSRGTVRLQSLQTVEILVGRKVLADRDQTGSLALVAVLGIPSEGGGRKGAGRVEVVEDGGTGAHTMSLGIAPSESEQRRRHCCEKECRSEGRGPGIDGFGGRWTATDRQRGGGSPVGVASSPAFQSARSELAILVIAVASKVVVGMLDVHSSSSSQTTAAATPELRTPQIVAVSWSVISIQSDAIRGQAPFVPMSLPPTAGKLSSTVAGQGVYPAAGRQVVP